MGCYINPIDRSKEEFLANYGVPTSQQSVLKFDEFVTSDVLPVASVARVFGSAVPILFDHREIEEFVVSQNATRLWFVPKRKLIQFMDQWAKDKVGITAMVEADMISTEELPKSSAILW